MIQTGNSLIDFDVIFPIQSSEFTEALNFGSDLKKKCNKTYIYSPKIDFYEYKNIFRILSQVDFDRSEFDLSD